MNDAVVTIKIDSQTKREAQKIAERLGMPLSVVIKAFLKQFIKTKTVEFSARDEEPSEYLIRTIKQAEKCLKAKKPPKCREDCEWCAYGEACASVL